MNSELFILAVCFVSVGALLFERARCRSERLGLAREIAGVLAVLAAVLAESRGAPDVSSREEKSRS